jgi:hypothetical protein
LQNILILQHVSDEVRREIADDRPAVYIDKERVFLNISSQQLAGYLKKLQGELAPQFEERQALLDKRQGQHEMTDAMYLDEVINASEVCATVMPLLYVLMDNLMLWIECEDGRLFQPTSLRCTDGLMILGVGDDSLSLEDACIKRATMPSQTRIKKGAR